MFLQRNVFYKRTLTYILISVRLWNFKDGGSKKARFLAKNQYTQRKSLYFENTGSTSLSKIGMILENKVV